MSSAIGIDGLTDAILQNMRDYNAEVVEKTNEIIEDVSKSSLKELKNSSPKSTGEYEKGWRSEKHYNKDGILDIKLHNKTHYQLTHLLEKGHAKSGGGRVNAVPHIAPVEEAVIQKISERIEREL